jgi:hypothetical protein
MDYDFIAIPDENVPQAADPLFQHLVVTYASETSKDRPHGMAWMSFMLTVALS